MMHRGEYRVLVGKHHGRRPLGRPRRRWEKILKWKWDRGHGLDRSGSEQGQMADSYKCGNEPSCSIKCREFHEELKTC
jgi:hypothetical protein